MSEPDMSELNMYRPGQTVEVFRSVNGEMAWVLGAYISRDPGWREVTRHLVSVGGFTASLPDAQVRARFRAASGPTVSGPSKYIAGQPVEVFIFIKSGMCWSPAMYLMPEPGRDGRHLVEIESIGKIGMPDCNVRPAMTDRHRSVVEPSLDPDTGASWARLYPGSVIKVRVHPATICEPDPINPSYYRGDRVMRIIEEFGLGFCLGNVVKYVLRESGKRGVECLKKARWYLDREIAQREATPPCPGQGSTIPSAPSAGTTSEAPVAVASSASRTDSTARAERVEVPPSSQAEFSIGHIAVKNTSQLLPTIASLQALLIRGAPLSDYPAGCRVGIVRDTVIDAVGGVSWGMLSWWYVGVGEHPERYHGLGDDRDGDLALLPSSIQFGTVVSVDIPTPEQLAQLARDCNAREYLEQRARDRDERRKVTDQYNRDFLASLISKRSPLSAYPTCRVGIVPDGERALTWWYVRPYGYERYHLIGPDPDGDISPKGYSHLSVLPGVIMRALPASAEQLAKLHNGVGATSEAPVAAVSQLLPSQPLPTMASLLALLSKSAPLSDYPAGCCVGMIYAGVLSWWYVGNGDHPVRYHGLGDNHDGDVSPLPAMINSGIVVGVDIPNREQLAQLAKLRDGGGK